MNYEIIVIKTKILAYHELYLELLKDDRIPYDVCQKIKEKIEGLTNTI